MALFLPSTPIIVTWMTADRNSRSYGSLQSSTNTGPAPDGPLPRFPYMGWLICCAVVSPSLVGLVLVFFLILGSLYPGSLALRRRKTLFILKIVGNMSLLIAPITYASLVVHPCCCWSFHVTFRPSPADGNPVRCNMYQILNIAGVASTEAGVWVLVVGSLIESEVHYFVDGTRSVVGSEVRCNGSESFPPLSSLPICASVLLVVDDPCCSAGYYF